MGCSDKEPHPHAHNGQALVILQSGLVARAMLQFREDFHHTSQETHGRVTARTFAVLREKHNPYNGAFEKPGPEPGSDSVYSKHNGATQNREELHIVFGSSCHL